MSYNLRSSNPKLVRSSSHNMGFEENHNLPLSNSKLIRSKSECYMRAIGRKRVISDGPEFVAFNSPFNSNKRRCHMYLDVPNGLESLPQEILVRVLCGVNQSDLKQLVFVSKTVKEAAIIAKETHFAFKTPSSKPVFQRDINCEDNDICNAPKQVRKSKPCILSKLESIAIALFREDVEA